MSYLRETHGAAVTASAVESQIVGYMGSTLDPANYNMIAIPFNTVDGKGIDLNNENDIKIENHSINDDYSEAEADLIEVWVPEMNSYDDFYFYSDENAWCSADGTDTPFIEFPGYEDGFPAGSTVWYFASKYADRDGDLKITVSGAVATESDTTYALDGGNYNMLANPYPVALDLNNAEQIVVTNHSINDDYSEAEADLIEVWVPEMNSYDDFYFYSDENAWCSADGTDTPFIEFPGYEDGIPAGKPFWYTASKYADRDGDLTIKFINPLKK